MNIYVGNLPYDISEQGLRDAFEPFGEVASAKIVRDRYSGQPRGFGFVEMPSHQEAREAINQLNGKELMGRRLIVNEAHSRSIGTKSGKGGQRPGSRSRRGRY